MEMDFAEAAVAVAALADELRGRIYAFVRGQPRPVSRDEVARQMGISRGLAAFHLDKLIETGWLSASYARPPGRGGRGAGRTSKYYEPSERQIEVSIPARRYDMIAKILLAAMQQAATDERAQDAARRIASERGEQLGKQARKVARIGSSRVKPALAMSKDILTACGFEPQDEKCGIALNNCPYKALVEEAREIVCPINQSFIEGMVRGLGNKAVEVVPVQRPRGCCVDLRSPTTTPV